MRIIPVIFPRPSAHGLLVAASLLLPARAEARQDASAGPGAAVSVPRADGWKPKGPGGEADSAPVAVATPDRAAPRNETAPPATTPEAREADGRARTDGPGTAPSRAPTATSSTKATASPKATASDGTPSGKGPTTRTLASGTGQMSLAAEKAAIDKVTAKTSIKEILAVTLPSRSDNSGDWSAGPEPLHRCGEPRWIDPCIPLPPCHPSLPPRPFDLVGVAGEPTDGPIYGGPCCPRTGSRDDGPWPHLHRVHDRFFDAFYRTK